MQTTFGTLAVLDYFTLEGETRIYRKVGTRTAWAFRWYFLGVPMYERRGSPVDLPFTANDKVTPCKAPSRR